MAGTPPGSRRVLKTVRVDESFVTVGTTVTVRGATAGLLDLFAPPIQMVGLPPEETTRLGFRKVGEGLRASMKSARERFR